MAKSQTPFPSIKEWKNQNLDSLIDAFTKKYGNKIDEAADFFEQEYDRAKSKHIRAHESEGLSP